MASKKTILLVEDEEPILFSVQRILELTGDYEIITSTNGSDALKKISNIIPDLIISDIAMPGMDGIELCKTIRKSEISSSIPFIFLTGKRDRLLEGIQSGSDDYLTKPFQVDELIAKIKAMFKRIERTKEQARLQKGNIADYSVDELLRICTSQAFSGELVLQSAGNEATLELEKGDIARISYKEYSEDKALDEIRKWQDGTFIMKPKTIRIRTSVSNEKPQPDEAGLNLDKAVQIGDDTWWVGYRNPETLLQINVYLRQFKNGTQVINYLIDPGSPVDFPVITKKISSVIGDLSSLHIYSINHQDPDVGMNSIFIKNINPKAICMTTEDNWRLVSHYEINPKSVKLINELKDWRVRLATRHELIYIPSPFCHFKGAFLTYDPKTRILFTGDLFGGISNSEQTFTLWAQKNNWDGIMAFHQLYMPTRKAIRYTLDLIRKLQPQPLVIAPQHGNIIRGELIQEFMDRLYDLPVGADLLDTAVIPEIRSRYTDALNEIINFAENQKSNEKVAEKLHADKQLLSMMKFERNKVKEIKAQPEKAITRLVMVLIRNESQAEIAQLKSVALKATVTRNLPAPALDWESTQTVALDPDHVLSHQE